MKSDYAKEKELTRSRDCGTMTTTVETFVVEKNHVSAFLRQKSIYNIIYHARRSGQLYAVAGHKSCSTF